MEIQAEPKNNSVLSVQIRKHQGDQQKNVVDILAVEEPLEIRLDYLAQNIRNQKSISITMRTPGHDYDLAVGFLFTEGLIQSPTDVTEVKHCGPPLPSLGHSNVVKVTLADSVSINLKSLERHFYTSSSCGVCGKSSIAALKTQNKFSLIKNAEPSSRFSAATISALPETLRKSQSIFDQTGGLHASALFRPDGTLIDLKEDVGRHNAMDKLIGSAFLNQQLPLSEILLLVSGRVSFELVQKASMAGVRILAAVGAPSSLALELAQEMDMTLIGFVRGDRFNVYHGDWRVL